MASCYDCIHINVCIAYEPEEADCICNQFKNKADLVEVVRCKDCDVLHNKWTGCPHLNGLIPPPNHYCACGTPKERDADKPKITCLNCKHLEITLPYGECNKQLRIVHPSDTCDFAEPKERGGEKWK